MRDEIKRPTLYNKVKTLSYIKSQVGPAYQNIVALKRKAEQAALQKKQDTSNMKGVFSVNKSAHELSMVKQRNIVHLHVQT